MRVPIGTDGWYLCDWRDQPDFAYTEFRGTETLALQWANQFKGGVFRLDALRRLLGGTSPPRNDERIVQEVASRLSSGVWLARRPIVVRVRRAAGGAPPSETAPAFSREGPLARRHPRLVRFRMRRCSQTILPPRRLLKRKSAQQYWACRFAKNASRLKWQAIKPCRTLHSFECLMPSGRPACRREWQSLRLSMAREMSEFTPL